MDVEYCRQHIPTVDCISLLALSQNRICGCADIIFTLENFAIISWQLDLSWLLSTDFPLPRACIKQNSHFETVWFPLEPCLYWFFCLEDWNLMLLWLNERPPRENMSFLTKFWPLHIRASVCRLKLALKGVKVRLVAFSAEVNPLFSTERASHVRVLLSKKSANLTSRL